jgi:DNA-binding SARP family transcriptional activator
MSVDESQIAANVFPTIYMIQEVLKDKNYYKIDELLSHLYVISQSNGDHSSLNNLLLSARQICVACSILHETTEWHRWASDEAEHQEQNLMQLLEALVELIETDFLANGDGDFSTGKYPITFKKQDPMGTNTGFWQRVRALLLGSGQLYASELPKSRTPSIELPSGQVSVPRPLRPQPAAQSPPLTDIDTYPDTNGEQHSRTDPETQTISTKSETRDGKPSFVIYGLGSFRVFRNGQPIVDWPNRKSKSLFKYLLLHRNGSVAKEVLMEIFWPDIGIDAARNNLNVTIYNLRQTLRQIDDSFSHILFQEDNYMFNPLLKIWLDFEAFLEHVKMGQNFENKERYAEAYDSFYSAQSLYQGELFEEDRYDNWIAPHRQFLHDQHIQILNRLSRYSLDRRDYVACVAFCNKQLVADACCEEAHRRLMQSYIAQGQHYLAMRQYQICVERLRDELDVSPSPETVELYEQIRAKL